MAHITFPPQTYFTKQEAAQYLRYSTRALNLLLAQGELKAYRPSRKLLFRREDLDAFVQRHPVSVDLDALVDDTLAALSVPTARAGR